jgi:hypothetical protein
MQIDFVRSGGVAGLSLKVSLDTSKLSPQDAAQLQQMVSASGLLNLPSRLASGAAGADRFQYRIAVRDSGREQNFLIDEAAAPPSLQPLLDHLTGLARRG